MRGIVKQIGLFALLILFSGLLFSCQASTPSDKPETDAKPTFSGLHDIEILQGDGVAYRDSVQATDREDGEIPFTVDASAVDLDTPGCYRVVYRAVDSAGNVVEAEVFLTVLAREVRYEQLWSVVDATIAQQGFSSLSRAELCEELYYFVKRELTYTSDSDKSDWVAEAYRAFTVGKGDCFTYYAMARAVFERMGISVLTVQRTPGALPSTHYWLMVNMGSEEAPAWYHFDACPHYKEYPLTSILLTDSQLFDYNELVPNYYAFDASRYPATPTQPYGK